MSAQILALPGVDPVATPAPPALAKARRIAAALDLLAICAEEVSLIAATGMPSDALDSRVFDARLNRFLDMMQLIAGR